MPPFGGRNFWQNSAEQLHHEVAPSANITTWQNYYFLFSHSSRRCLHSLRVGATQENNSLSV